MKPSMHLSSYLAKFFLEGEMFLTKFVEKIKPHILSLITFFFFQNHAIYEMKITVHLDRPQMTVLHMSTTCWILATDTNSDYVILNALLLQQWLHKCASVLHVHCLSCLPTHR